MASPPLTLPLPATPPAGPSGGLAFSSRRGTLDQQKQPYNWEDEPYDAEEELLKEESWDKDYEDELKNGIPWKEDF